MGSELLLYGYGAVCLSMLVFNIVYNISQKRRIWRRYSPTPQSSSSSSRSAIMRSNTIRLPTWESLRQRFSNPSEMMVHDDYYENYGVENLKIREMYLGVGERSEYRIPMTSVPLKGWGQNRRPAYRPGPGTPRPDGE